MANIFARMRQLTGTTAEWAANNLVLALGEVGVERGVKTMLKVGDGVTVYSGLPYVAGDADITGVTAGSGLTGGGSSGDVTIAVDWLLVAPLLSPAFTGTPTTPNVAPATVSNATVANTAFVQSAISAALTGVYAPLNSPLFTGDPRTTTDPPIDDADRSIPSTKWVTDYFLKLKGGALTGPLTSSSTISTTGFINTTSTMQAMRFDSYTAVDAAFRWISTGNVVDGRKWRARHLSNNLLRFARMSEADAELVYVDLNVEGSVVPSNYATIPQARNDGTLASTNWIALKLNDFLSKSLGGVVTGDVTFTGNTFHNPVAGKKMTVPPTPLAATDNDIAATPAWIRDLLLTRTGTRARYVLSSFTDADVNPGPGKMTIENLPDEIVEGVTFKVRRIAISTTDQENKERYLMVLMPGDSLILTDYVETPPVTAFARYVIVETPIPIPTPPPPPAPPTGVLYVKFDCYRIEQRGALPVANDELVVTGFLNTATGDGPIIAINAGDNLSIDTTGGATGASGTVTIDLDQRINLAGVLVDPVGMIGAAVLPQDGLEIGPSNTTISGGRARWRGAPTTGTKDMVVSIADDLFAWSTYAKGVFNNGVTVGWINMITMALHWKNAMIVGPGVLSAVPTNASTVQATSLTDNAAVFAVGASGYKGAVGAFDKTPGNLGAYLQSGAGFADVNIIDYVGNNTGNVMRMSTGQLLVSPPTIRWGPGNDGALVYDGSSLSLRSLTSTPLYLGTGGLYQVQLSAAGEMSLTTNAGLTQGFRSDGNVDGAYYTYINNVSTGANAQARLYLALSARTNVSVVHSLVWNNEVSPYYDIALGAGVTGGLVYNGKLTATQFNATNTTASYQISGAPVLARGSYTTLYDTASLANVLLGSGGDPTNYHRQTTHRFESIAGGTTFLTIASASVSATPPILAASPNVFTVAAFGNTSWPLRLSNGSANANTGVGISFDPIAQGINVRDAQIRVTTDGSNRVSMDFYVSASATPTRAVRLHYNNQAEFFANTGVFATPTTARLQVGGGDGGYHLGLQGSTKGLRAYAHSGGAQIDGVDSSLTTSFQPLILNGSVLRLQGNSVEKLTVDSAGAYADTLAVNTNDSRIATTAHVYASVRGSVVRIGGIGAANSGQYFAGGGTLVNFSAHYGGSDGYWNAGVSRFVPAAGMRFTITVTMTFQGSANNDIARLSIRRIVPGATDVSYSECQRYNNGPFSLATTYSNNANAGDQYDILIACAGDLTTTYGGLSIVYQL